MTKPTPHEAIIHLMVVTSASDRDMTDLELARIGDVVHSWPVFVDYDPHDILAAAQACQRKLQEEDGLEGVLAAAAEAIPQRLHDTAYAAALEVAVVDLEMRLEEARVMQRILAHLDLAPADARAIERAAKARHRTLT